MTCKTEGGREGTNRVVSGMKTTMTRTIGGRRRKHDDDGDDDCEDEYDDEDDDDDNDEDEDVVMLAMIAIFIA